MVSFAQDPVLVIAIKIDRHCSKMSTKKDAKHKKLLIFFAHSICTIKGMGMKLFFKKQFFHMKQYNSIFHAFLPLYALMRKTSSVNDVQCYLPSSNSPLALQ